MLPLLEGPKLQLPLLEEPLPLDPPEELEDDDEPPDESAFAIAAASAALASVPCLAWICPAVAPR